MADLLPLGVLESPIAGLARRNLDCSAKEIAERCSTVQKGWTNAEKRRRLVGRRGPLLLLARLLDTPAARGPRMTFRQDLRLHVCLRIASGK
jgi:hypothetical protein